MRKTLLLMSLLVTLAPGAKRRDSEPNKEQTWKAEKLQKELERAVAAKFKGEVQSEIKPGPADTLLVRAWYPGAYPGTGVMSAFVAKNATSYGIHGERDFAEFVRAEGWLQREPDVHDFLKLADYAQFEAVVMNLEHLEKPVIKNEGRGLVLYFVRGFMPNGAYPTEVVVGKTGPVKVERRQGAGLRR